MGPSHPRTVELSSWNTSRVCHQTERWTWFWCEKIAVEHGAGKERDVLIPGWYFINSNTLAQTDSNEKSAGAFLQAAGNTIPIYYMTTYSTSVLSYSPATGSLLLAVNSAVNSLSRVGMGALADQLGRQNTMVASVHSFFVEYFPSV
jgi:hypothetical protein